MTILITGVAGFIGFNYAKFLLDKSKKYKIIGIDNFDNYYSVSYKKKRISFLNKYKNFFFYKVDIKNYNNLNNIFIKNKISVVYNFAAQAGVRYSLVNPDSYIQNNILGFFNILKISKDNNVNKFFYASSSSVYGESKKFPLKEKEILNPKNIYGLSKKINEEISALDNFKGKMKIIGLRFFTVFGEWGRPDMFIIKYLYTLYKKKSFYLNNFGNHHRDFTYINDVCKILFLLKNKINLKNNLILNICSNKPYKLTYIIDLINKFSNLGTAHIKKRKMQKADILKTHGNNNLVKKLTNFKNFTKVEIAIKNTSVWFRHNYKKLNFAK